MDETEMEASKLEGVGLLSSECGTYKTVMAKCGTYKTVMAHIRQSHIRQSVLGLRGKSLKAFELFLQVARGCVMLMDETEMEASKLEAVGLEGLNACRSSLLLYYSQA